MSGNDVAQPPGCAVGYSPSDRDLSTQRVQRLRDRRRRGVRCLVTVEITDRMLENLVRRGLLTLSAGDRTSREDIAQAVAEATCR